MPAYDDVCTCNTAHAVSCAFCFNVLFILHSFRGSKHKQNIVALTHEVGGLRQGGGGGAGGTGWVSRV